MNGQQSKFISIAHRWAIAGVCSLSLFCYCLLNSQTLSNAAYMTTFSEQAKDLKDRQTKSFMTFVFEEATSSLQQTIFKRLK